MAISESAGNNTSVLSENPILRYITFIVLYFSQGIPEGITILAIPAWMAMNGKSALEIAGYSAAVMVPFSLKILLAPMMERFTYLPMGRRRPWLLFGQFGIICGLLTLASIPDPLNNISVIMAVVICLHIFIMIQDIATDSLVIDVVPIEQQGRANSLMWGSKTIGSSVSLFAGSWLINAYSFSEAVMFMSSSVLLIMFVPLLIRERKGEKLIPWGKGQTSPDAALLAVDSWTKLFKSFKQVVLLRNSLILLTAVFVTLAALHYMRTMLPMFTIQELGWDNVHYSKIYAASSLTGGVTGMLIGAIVILRFGIIRLIQVSCTLMIILACAMALLVPYWKIDNLVYGFIAMFCTLLTLINIGVLALAMHLCWKRISAMQFTFCMTVFNMGLASGAALLGALRTEFDWQVLFIIFGLMIVVSMIVLRFIQSKRHLEQVDSLEQNYLEVLKAEGSLLAKGEPN